MRDEEAAAVAARALGCRSEDARVERLGGSRALLTCRVAFPGGNCCVLKVVPAGPRHEAALSARLCNTAPDLVAPVLAWSEDERRQWVVTADLGPVRLADRPTPETYTDAARVVARLQAATLPDLEALAALGLPRVQPADWEDMALRVLDAVQRAPNRLLWRHVSEVERAAWTTSDLARDTLSLPEALVHGDLHAGNVALTAHGVRLLDWGSAYLGPALLALEELVWPAERHLRGQNDLAAVRSAYLREWAPVLGKPAPWARARLACRALVRLVLLEDALSGRLGAAGPGEYDAAVAARGFVDAWHEWNRERP